MSIFNSIESIFRPRFRRVSSYANWFTTDCIIQTNRIKDGLSSGYDILIGWNSIFSMVIVITSSSHPILDPPTLLISVGFHLSVSGYIPYLREYKEHLFQPNIAFKIGVRVRFEGALDSSTYLNNIQLYRFLRNNV